MATAKKSVSTTKSTGATKAASANKPAAKSAGNASTPLKPIKESFSKTGLIAHLAEIAGQDPKAVKLVISALEATIIASLNKKGVGTFTLPGLLKVTALQVAATKKRTGIDPFTKQERAFAAKPATVRVKVRPLKKLKDAAL